MASFAAVGTFPAMVQRAHASLHGSLSNSSWRPAVAARTPFDFRARSRTQKLYAQHPSNVSHVSHDYLEDGDDVDPPADAEARSPDGHSGPDDGPDDDSDDSEGEGGDIVETERRVRRATQLAAAPAGGRPSLDTSPAPDPGVTLGAAQPSRGLGKGRRRRVCQLELDGRLLRVFPSIRAAATFALGDSEAEAEPGGQTGGQPLGHPSPSHSLSAVCTAYRRLKELSRINAPLKFGRRAVAVPATPAAAAPTPTTLSPPSLATLPLVSPLLKKSSASSLAPLNTPLKVSVAGYGWCYEEDYDARHPLANPSLFCCFPDIDIWTPQAAPIDFDVLRPYVMRRTRPVYGLTLAGQRLALYDSAKSAAAATPGASARGINGACRGAAEDAQAYRGRLWQFASADDLADPGRADHPHRTCGALRTLFPGVDPADVDLDWAANAPCDTPSGPRLQRAVWVIEAATGVRRGRYPSARAAAAALGGDAETVLRCLRRDACAVMHTPGGGDVYLEPAGPCDEGLYLAVPEVVRGGAGVDAPVYEYECGRDWPVGDGASVDGASPPPVLLRAWDSWRDVASQLKYPVGPSTLHPGRRLTLCSPDAIAAAGGVDPCTIIRAEPRTMTVGQAACDDIVGMTPGLLWRRAGSSAAAAVTVMGWHHDTAPRLNRPVVPPQPPPPPPTGFGCPHPPPSPVVADPAIVRAAAASRLATLQSDLRPLLIHQLSGNTKAAPPAPTPRASQYVEGGAGAVFAGMALAAGRRPATADLRFRSLLSGGGARRREV